MLYSIPNPATGAAHFGDWALELGTLSILGWEPFAGSPVQIYVGFVALAGNLVVAALATVVLQQLRVFNGTDKTTPQDYHADPPSRVLDADWRYSVPDNASLHPERGSADTARWSPG